MNEYESGLIGACMLDRTAIESISLLPIHFTGHNQEIYQAILDVYRQNRIPDLITVSEHLQKITGSDWSRQVAGAATLACIKSLIPQYCEHLKNKFKQRCALDTASSLISEINNHDENAVDKAIARLMELTQESRNYEHSMKSCLLAAREDIDSAYKAGGMIGLSSGIKDLDSLLGGFHKTDLITIGARPAMGKTALMLNMALSDKVKAGIISTEQPMNQLGARVLSINSNVHLQKLRLANLNDEDWQDITRSIVNLKDREFYCNDKSSQTILDIKRQARQWKHKYNINALFVDYIQRIKPIDPRQNKLETVSQTAEGLKDIARELGIPVVTLAQVNRGVESRIDKRPNMGDLKDSGVIEQESDVIMFLYRDEVYNNETHEKNTAEIIIEKNRSGPTGLVKTQWNGACLKFSGIDEGINYERF